MRLIDADTFKAYMNNALEQTRNAYPDKGEWAETITEQFCEDIDDQPTVYPDSDTISRQQAIDALDNLDYMPGEWSVRGLSLCKGGIKALPPSPSRPKGRWKTIAFLTVECSECHAQIHELEYGNFCPNCGADMRQ